MGKIWIVDMLADLRAFSAVNDLPALAAHLEEAERIARRELSEPGSDPSGSAQSVTQGQG